jgi:hypothetical protein
MKYFALTFLAAVTFTFGCAPTNYDLGPSPNQSVPTSETADGGFDHKIVLAELYASDPLRHDYDFIRADYGAVIKDGVLYNAGSHLDYSTYYPGDFTVAIQGGNIGAIVDLGLDQDVAASLGASETSGGGQGFAALVLKDGRFGLPAADAVLDRAKSDLSNSNDPGSHVTPLNGHVFLVRIADTNDAALDLVVKLSVVSLTPGDRVACEWMRLR